MNAQAHASGLPPSLIVSSLDFDRLEALLDSPALQQTPAIIALMDELKRAEIRAPEAIPASVVTMNSVVDCIDENSGEQRRITLVYPRDADLASQRISVLTPVGSALLGLSVGQRIDWRTGDGRVLRLRVAGIAYQPEASGDFHR